MPLSDKLLAWIEPRSTDEFVAAFVGEGAAPDERRDFAGRAPAIQFCSSREEAQQWIEDQATALDLSVRWLDEGPCLRP